MRIEAKGNRAIVRFDKIGEAKNHTQALVDWCKGKGMIAEHRANGLSVKFSSADDAESDLAALTVWCKEHAAADVKNAAVVRASEYRPGQVSPPIFQTEQRTPLEMWNLWYKILREKFPAVIQPKKVFKRELGMLRIMLDAYDHLMVEKIFQTAAGGWAVMTLKHRGLSEVPTLELVMKFRSELQSAASGGGLTSKTQRVPQGPDADKAYDDYKK